MPTATPLHAGTDAIWILEVDGTRYRWSIWADDSGIEIHVQFLDLGGTLLVIKGLTYDPVPADWRLDNRYASDARFTSLPDQKVIELITLALARGWRHDMDQQIFRL
ncbi:MAG: hypothetical protein ACFHX7_23335 [Pseudomonadota bacterium]